MAAGHVPMGETSGRAKILAISAAAPNKRAADLSRLPFPVFDRTSIDLVLSGTASTTLNRMSAMAAKFECPLHIVDDLLGPLRLVTRGRTIVGIGVILFWLTACGTETQPTPVTPTPQPTASPIASVSISGVPVSPAIGGSAQLTARITRQDGTASDGTSQVTWLSSDVSVASISAAGLLTIAAPGEADITATLQAVRATAHLTVPRPGPVLYDLDGVVHETAPTDDVVLSGATVGIHYVGCPTCPHDNESTVTDASGRFRLGGLEAPGFAFVVTKPGYDVVSYGIMDLPRDQHPTIAVSPSSLVVHELFSKDCRSSSAPGSATTRFAVHRDGVLHRGPYFGPTSEGGENRLEYRQVTAAGGPFVGMFSSEDFAVRGGFFYEIRVSWLSRCDRGPFTLEFSHPN